MKENISYILGKVLTNSASQDETDEFNRWINESDKHKDSFIKIQSLWSNETSDSETVNTDEKLKILRNRIKTIDNNYYVPGSNNRKLKVRKLILNITKYAAVVVVCMSLGVLGTRYYLNSYNDGKKSCITEVNVPYGQTANVYLSDGTSVMLNSGSKLSYSDGNDKDEDVVSLSGEAFFDVTHNPDRKFIVRTKHLDLAVYGTSFNVEAYKNSEMTRATLVTGKIGVKNRVGSVQAILSPGYCATYNSSINKLTKKKVDISMYTSWRNGIVVFKNETIRNIAKKMEVWYNVKIVFANKEYKKRRFSGAILKNKPVDQILEILKLTTGIKYRIEVRQNKPSLVYIK